MTENKAGFTLIELLIIITIIGILVAVLVPSLISARTKANDSAANTYAVKMAQMGASWMLSDPANTAANLPNSCTDLIYVAEGALETLPSSIEDCTVTPGVGGSFIVEVTSVSGNTFTRTW